jgi:hypothetical protein
VLSWLAKPQRPNLLALLVYLELSICLFGLRVLAGPATSYLGYPHDPGQAIWFLEWWPRAILHAHNPFYSQAVWAPVGVNLTWMTSIPGLSLLAAPITLTLGPVVAYNILALAAPAVSAWAAYILCRHIVQEFWPSLFGGWVYGFSTYELTHVLVGHLCLSWILVPPLCVCLVLGLIRGTVRQHRFVLYFWAALTVQFLISLEVFATMTMFGAIALLMGALLMPEMRTLLYRTTRLMTCAYGFTAIVVSPFLYNFFFVHGLTRDPIFPPMYFATDILAPFIPRPLTYVSLASRELPGAWENGAYLGPALLALVVSFGLWTWHQPVTRVLLGVLGCVVLASLGPRLYVAGQPTILLPWSLVTTHLPVLNNALPARFMLFAWLVIAVIASIWLAGADKVGIRTKTLLALLSMAFLFPRPLYLWQARTDVDTPPFFSSGLYRHYIRPGANILIVPYAQTGESMLWQAQAGMDFQMAGGWAGAVPQEFLRWPMVNALLSSHLMPNYGYQLKAFLARYQVEAVVVSDTSNRPWQEVFAKLGAKPVKSGGVTLYDVPSQIRVAYRSTSLDQMEQAADAAWFAELLRAADTYLSRGFPANGLSPGKAAHLSLLPGADWAENLEAVVVRRRVGGPMLWFGPWPGDRFAIGIAGSYSAIKPLIGHYSADADAVYFPYPDKLPAAPATGDTPEILLMVFRREGLARAAGRSVAQRVVREEK